MKTKIQRSFLASAVVLTCGVLACSNALAAEYWLCAGSFNKTMPDNSVVRMWGYADVTNVAGHACPAAINPAYTSPGPRLNVPVGDARLTVHIQNTLGEATSLVIPGQTESAMAPVMIGNRVHSFTHEAASGASDVYTWGTTTKPLRPGSYIYQTGTHPAKQVQMGLYGAVVKNQGLNQAYPGGAAFSYTTEVIQFFSEIDPALHSRVASGAYGANCENPASPCTSTIDYNPTWFLINGNAFVDPSPALPTRTPAGIPGTTTLIRFFNMGLRTHNMVLQGDSMKVIAEDGFVSPAPHDQYSLAIAAGKTHDVLFKPTAVGVYPLYERMHSLSAKDRTTNNKTGGLMSFLNVAAGNNNPPLLNAIPTPQAATVGAAFSVTAVGADADVGDTLVYSMSGNPAWLGVNGSNGVISGTPNAIGSSIVTVTVTDSAGAAASQTFTLNVTGASVSPTIYFSTLANANPTGLAGTADDADIYSWDGTAFGRAVNMSHNPTSETGFITNPIPATASVDELKFVDATHFYVSFGNDVTLPGLGLVQDEDIVYYNNGIWSVFFDGTAAGLASATAATDADLDMDAFTTIGNVIYFSTVGTSNPPGLTGTADNADIYSWNGTVFTRVVNMALSPASETGVIANPVPTTANVDGLKFVDPTHFYLSFSGDVTLTNTGGTLAVQDEDIVYYNNGVWSVFFDGTPGLGALTTQQIDGFDIIPLP